MFQLAAPLVPAVLLAALLALAALGSTSLHESREPHGHRDPRPQTDARPNPWTVGKPVPDLELPTIDGGRLALSSLRGKRVLLIEFASW